MSPFALWGARFDQLAMVLAGAFASFGNARDWKSIRDVLHPAADNANGAHLLDLASDLRIAAGRREATVLLVVDQLEELLGQDADPSESLFLRWLNVVLSQPSSPFLAVATFPLQSHQSATTSVAFSPDGTLASGSDDRTVKLWQLDEASSKTSFWKTLDQQEEVTDLSFSPTGKTLALASKSNTIKIWRIEDTTPLKPTISVYQGGVESLSFSPDGDTLVSGSLRYK